jgi:hypothetical protein
MAARVGHSAPDSSILQITDFDAQVQMVMAAEKFFSIRSG